jgi:hypothetical protein
MTGAHEGLAGPPIAPHIFHRLQHFWLTRQPRAAEIIVIQQIADRAPQVSPLDEPEVVS